MTNSKRGVIARLLGFAHHHPVLTCLLLAFVIPFFLLFSVWTYLRVTTTSYVAAQLRAMGLPANGLELETWQHPEDDGCKEFRQAINMTEALVDGQWNEKYDPLTAIDVDYAKAQAEFDALAQQLAPITALMKKAGAHEALSWNFSYRQGMAAKTEGLMEYRQYALLMAALAQYRGGHQLRADEAVDDLLGLQEINSRLQCYSLIEYLVKIACYGIYDQALGRLINSGQLTKEQLLQIRKRMSEVKKSVLNEEHTALVGEYCLALTSLNDNEYLEKHGYNEIWTPIKSGHFSNIRCTWLFRDLEQYLILDNLKRGLELEQGTYPQIKDSLDAYKKEYEERERSWIYQRIFYANIGLSPGLITSAFAKQKHKMYAQMSELEIACSLLIDLQDGNSLPQDLSNPRWPRDPYTNQPFHLTIIDDYVIVSSAGEDMKHYDKLAEKVQAGEYREGAFMVNGADDLVYRFKRKLTGE